MPMPTKNLFLFDATSGANAAISTGVLNVKDYDILGILLKASGGTFNGTATADLYLFDGSGSPVLVDSRAPTGGAQTAIGGWGDDASSTSGGPIAQAPVPNFMQLDVGAMGIGVTVRVIVWGRRKFRGPSASLTPD